MQAQQELRRLQQERLLVLAPYPIILETYTLVQRRLGLTAAHTWLEEILAGTRLINATPNDYLEAVRRVRALADQPLTLFDGVLAVLSARLALPVWTYDYHFDLLGVAVWR